MRLETETIPYKQLTHEVIQPIKGRATAITIIGTIIFLFLANWAVLWLGQAYPYNRGYWLVQQKWELLQGLSAPVDWLIVGDSTGNQGLVPDVMEARLGGTAVNLNTVGNMGALDDVWMLEAHIEEFGPPAHVLVIHAYDIWSRDITSAFVAKAPLAWNSWQDSFLPPLSATPLEKLNLWLARYVPLYADNLSLDRLIQDRVFLQRPIFRQRFSALAIDARRGVVGPEPDLPVRRVAERLRSRVPAPAQHDRVAPWQHELVPVRVDHAHRALDLVRPIRPRLDRDLAHRASVGRDVLALDSDQ
jgi:hypothetical protein